MEEELHETVFLPVLDEPLGGLELSESPLFFPSDDHIDLSAGVGAGFADGVFGATNGEPSGALNYFAGGGGGGTGNSGPAGGAGGLGGGGDGATTSSASPGAAFDGTANTGGGAGGYLQSPDRGSAGGSGIVVIRYKFQ